VRNMMVRLTSVAASLLLALLVVGCGRSTSPLVGDASRGTASLTPQPSVAGQTAPGQVTLTLSQRQYSAEDPLLVTIHNGLDTTIWIQDPQASCTSLVVERLDQGNWQPTGACAPSRPAHTLAIPSGSAVAQRLDYAHEMDTGAGWPAGAYRVALTYGLSGTATASTDGLTVYSPEFTVA
jgi:hypothetical protein